MSTAIYGSFPVPTRRNARSHALDTIRQKIITVELAPGAQLSENVLAGQLGLSRTPIRESLILLAEERLVFVVPQVGTVVAPILLSEVETAQFVREALELTALKESFSRVTPENIAELNTIIDAQRFAESRGSLPSFFVLDEEFHSALMGISGHGSAWRSVSQAKAHLDRARHLSLAVNHNIGFLIGQHQQIVDSLARGENEATETALRAHLRKIYEDIATIRADNPLLFGDRPADR
jgi:DNA-binding GntR family transcriptional regulator